ncbi:MAG: phosphonate ABC transporter, permease protein PhnE [Rhizobiaceae bacterium]|nr:phosphonate ABC transporter, permease protein PhnE [Rhizobiaceae bacterium]
MSAFSRTERDALMERHPEVFSKSRGSLISKAAIAASTAAYFAFAWWFFSIGSVFSEGRWDIAGAYLADWVSYESRPDIEFGEKHLEVNFPRFDPAGKDPDPEWLLKERAVVERTVTIVEQTVSGGGSRSSSNSLLGTIGGAAAPSGSSGGFAPSNTDPEVETLRQEEVVRVVADMSGAGTIEIMPGLVIVTRGGETMIADITLDEAVTVRGALPEWALQKAPGAKVIVKFGFSGRAEIEGDEVKVRHRFLGWENFLFDTNSAFWGKSANEVISLIVSGERIDPGRSNLAIAWDDILNNSEWQHYDVWLKLLQTIVMAFAGTLLATIVAFPLAFMAARNIMPNRFLNQVSKRTFDFLRSVDMLIWALFFTRAFGPGPLAGISAIFFTDTGTFGKLYSEALENIDDKQREGVRSVGASPSSVQRFGVVPQVLPVFLAQSLYFWESNTRSATIIGAVGAGGIGLKLWEAMRTNQDWENVAYMVVLILAVVFVFDNISSKLRQQLIAPKQPN